MTLERMLISYRASSAAASTASNGRAVHGALRRLADLARWLAPRRVRLVGPVDALGRATPMTKSALRFRDIAAGSPPFDALTLMNRANGPRRGGFDVGGEFSGKAQCGEGDIVSGEVPWA